MLCFTPRSKIIDYITQQSQNSVLQLRFNHNPEIIAKIRSSQKQSNSPPDLRTNQRSNKFRDIPTKKTWTGARLSDYLGKVQVLRISNGFQLIEEAKASNRHHENSHGEEIGSWRRAYLFRQQFPLTLFLSEDRNGNRNSSKEQPSLIPEFPIGKKGFPKNTDCGVPNW